MWEIAVAKFFDYHLFGSGILQKKLGALACLGAAFALAGQHNPGDLCVCV